MPSSRLSTVLATLDRLKIVSSESLVLHIVGADEREIIPGKLDRVKDKYSPLFQSLAERGVKSLSLSFVGPNLVFPYGVQSSSGSFTFQGEIEIHLEAHLQLYHEFYDPDVHIGAQTPDLIILFNAGIWGYDDWLPTLALFRTMQNSVVLVTSYTLEEAEDDMDTIEDVCGDFVKWAFGPERNPHADSVKQPRSTNPENRSYYENAAIQAFYTGTLSLSNTPSAIRDHGRGFCGTNSSSSSSSSSRNSSNTGKIGKIPTTDDHATDSATSSSYQKSAHLTSEYIHSIFKKMALPGEKVVSIVEAQYGLLALLGEQLRLSRMREFAGTISLCGMCSATQHGCKHACFCPSCFEQLARAVIEELGPTSDQLLIAFFAKLRCGGKPERSWGPGGEAGHSHRNFLPQELMCKDDFKASLGRIAPKLARSYGDAYFDAVDSLGVGKVSFHQFSKLN